MRVLFFGTSPFAVPTLHALLESPSHEVIGVVTQPDKPSGRGLQLQQSPVKKAALDTRSDLHILQPEKARRKVFLEEVATLSPEVLVVAAFGQILPQKLLDMPKFGGINVHGSLLPRWRGAAPMQYALISGDKETGVTTMQMDAGLDTGDMLLKESVPIDDLDTIDSIEEKLSAIGGPLLLETLKRLIEGNCPREAQDESLATWAPSLPPDFGYLDWTKPANELSNLIRGVTPRPSAWIFFGGKKIKVWSAKQVSDASDERVAGEVTSAKDGVTVSTGDGLLRLDIIQPEGKPRMSASDWARGARVQPGMRFEPAS